MVNAWLHKSLMQFNVLDIVIFAIVIIAVSWIAQKVFK